MTYHSRQAFAAVMGMFNDAPEESEPTRSVVTSLIVPPAPQNGFAVFDDSNTPSQSQQFPANNGGFAVFEDSGE